MKRILTFLICTVLLMTSCEKQEIQNLDQQELNSDSKLGLEDLKVRNGILVFSSKAHLKTIANTLEKKRTDGDKTFSMNTPGFISLREARLSLSEADMERLIENNDYSKIKQYYRIVEQGDEKRLLPKVEDVLFESLVNKDGFIIVGSNLYQIKDEVILELPLSSDMKNNIGMDGAKSYPIERQVSTSSTRNFKALYGSTNYVVNGQEYRFIGDFKKSNWLVYQRIYVQVWHERRKSGWFGVVTWPSATADYLSFNASGTFQEGSLTFPFSNFTGSNYSTSETARTMTETVNMNCNWITTYGQANCLGVNGTPINFIF